jgi:outer membrane biosynthesis protein TonB|tara:strand:+ start:45729 stop:46289 length:561 start_codon:yes stop_codon:yes gene_type:complete
MFLTLTPIDSMKNLLTLTFSILLASSAWAQSADEYFHGGAQSFINADLQTAINQVQNGLNNYPNDPKLNALMQKLQEEQEKQQQQQNQDQQQQQQQQNQEQQEQEQQEQEQENEEQQEQQEQQESEGENQEEQDPQDMNPEDLKSQQISKEDAEKILQALAQKEKELLKEFKKKKSDGSAKHEKDW